LKSQLISGVAGVFAKATCNEVFVGIGMIPGESGLNENTGNATKCVRIRIIYITSAKSIR
jgi:hypothetical protein